MSHLKDARVLFDVTLFVLHQDDGAYRGDGNQTKHLEVQYATSELIFQSIRHQC